MKQHSLKICLLAFTIVLAIAAPGIAQGNLDVDPDSSAGGSEQLDPAEVAALEFALLGGASPLVVPAADFSDDGFLPGTSSFSFASGLLSGGSYGCSMAPVYLPDGATVTDLFATVIDTSASDVSLSLRKREFFGTTVTTMATATSSGTPGQVTISDSSITGPVTSNHSVYLTSCFSSGLGILSARIYFIP